MNFFALFHLPETLSIDREMLKSRYAEYIALHPEEEARAREACRILEEPESRAQHLLQLHGMDGERNASPLSEDFLMQVMDLNEILMEIELQGLEEKRTELSALFQSLAENNDRLVRSYFEQTSPQLEDDDLQVLQTWLARKKYLERVRNQMKGKL